MRRLLASVVVGSLLACTTSCSTGSASTTSANAPRHPEAAGSGPASAKPPVAVSRAGSRGQAPPLGTRVSEEAASASSTDPVEPKHPRTDVAWLGVELRALEETDRGGVLLGEVFRGSPAALSGLARGDVVLSVDGQPMVEPGAVQEAIRRHEPGDQVPMLIERGGTQRLLRVKLDGQPDKEDLIRFHFVGQRAPDFGPLRSIQGSGIGWDDLRGRVVVIEFWARWCGVCRFLVPVMNRWHRLYRPQGVSVIGLTSDPFESAERTAREHRMVYPLATDPSGQTTLRYRANTLPSVFVIDQRGVIRDVMVGLSKRRLEEIETLVERLLAAG